MEKDQKIIEYSRLMYEQALPHISVDSVVFGFSENQLKVLLLKITALQKWLLPGGFVMKNENLIDAAQRVLRERTGAERIYLQEFGSFGNVHRYEHIDDPHDDDIWHKQRFISIGFYALIDHSQVKLKSDPFSDHCEWKNIGELPELALDHQQIYDVALTTLREQMSYKPIGINLLPARFTIAELQKLYETILGKTLNRGNFYRRIMKFDMLVRQPDQLKDETHKSSHLYSFNPVKYYQSLQGIDW